MTDPWMTIIQSIPGIGPALPWVTLVITVASLLATQLPGPTVKHGVYYYFYQGVNTIAVNFGHAKNLNAPESTGIVGGASATSAPLLATDVVPQATATAAQKVVTTMPTAASAAVTPVSAAVIAGQQAAADFAAKKALAPQA